MSQVVACSALAHALVAVVRGASADAGQPATGCHRSGSPSRVSTAPLGGAGSAGRCCAFEASSLRQALLKVCVPSSNGLVTTRSVTRMNAVRAGRVQPCHDAPSELDPPLWTLDRWTR